MARENSESSVGKWTKDAVEALIEAWEQETVLFNIKSENYHNRHLRKEALERVVNSVKQKKPDVTEADAIKKFNNLRTEFVKEKGKVEASKTSGAGTDDVYQPSLWYYKKLLFLSEHVVARKSRASKITTRSPVCSEENSQQSYDSQVTVTNEGFDENGRLNVFLEDSNSAEKDDDLTQINIDPTDFQFLPGPSNSGNDRSQSLLEGYCTQSLVELPASTSAPPSSEKVNETPRRVNQRQNQVAQGLGKRLASQSLTDKNDIKKAKVDVDYRYCKAMESVASSLCKEDKVEKSENTAFCDHLFTILKSIEDPEMQAILRAEVMKLAIEAQLTFVSKKYRKK